MKITFLLGLENGKLDVLKEVTEKALENLLTEIYEIIFRSNSSFTFTRGDSKVTGQYNLDSEGNINLVNLIYHTGQ